MNLQSLYQDIIGFWKNIAPLVVAHVAIAIAGIWISKKTLGNISERSLRYFRSADYLQWKRVFADFDLMPKIPFLLAILILIYLAILSSLLNVLTVGFSNPLAFIHSDSEFWLETNDEALTYALKELASYQATTSLTVNRILEFRNGLLNQYELSNPQEYRSYVTWTDDSHREWSKYYQVCIASFALFMAILARELLKKNKSIHLPRVFIVLVFLSVSILATRYVGEQYIEKESRAKTYFVLRMIRNDVEWNDQKLDDQSAEALECQIYSERTRFGLNPVEKHFWISRAFEGFLRREFSTNSEHPWEPPSTCQQ